MRDSNGRNDANCVHVSKSHSASSVDLMEEGPLNQRESLPPRDIADSPCQTPVIQKVEPCKFVNMVF